MEIEKTTIPDNNEQEKKPEPQKRTSVWVKLAIIRAAKKKAASLNKEQPKKLT
jgi:hypothetical protein